MIHLSVDSLQKRYGNHVVLRDLNFSCNTTILGIAGVNGSGKSTFLKCCTGLAKPTSGSINWTLDQNEITPSDMKLRVGFAAPYIQLYEELTVTENLQFLHDLQNSRGNFNPETILTRFDAEHLAEKLYGNLSTGQQQRVKLASSIIKNPPVLVLDEPGSNLDIAGKQLVEKLVSDCRDDGIMVLLASNQSDELDLCDQILDLNHAS
jgi:ABC-type multidrug transport system ATPase subunit